MARNVFNFEKLEAWQEAVKFAALVYRLTENFPAEERFGLKVQMRKAGTSVPSNLAEGCSRSSRADFARFIEISTGSVFEVVSHSAVALLRGYITKEDRAELYAAAERQSRMNSGLRKSLVGDR